MLQKPVNGQQLWCTELQSKRDLLARLIAQVNDIKQDICRIELVMQMQGVPFD